MKRVTDNPIEALINAGAEIGEVMMVPYYGCGVQAGLPTDMGDPDMGSMYVPKDLVGDGTIYTIRVRGESMTGFDIREGDTLMVCLQNTARSGDIVIASINGTCTVKTFFEDETGNNWLLPGNPAFEPILLNPDDNNRIAGVVKQIMHESPRISYRECVSIIRQSKKEQKHVISQADIAHALRVACDAMAERGMSGSRPWFAVYRAFTDKDVIARGDYQGFVSLLDSIMGEEAPSINIKDMRANIDVGCFQKPLALWNEANAPVRGKRYHDYLEIAKCTMQALDIY